MTQAQPKKSDLPVRAASAMVMVAVAGTALWLGGWWWTVFVAAAGLGVMWEWVRLAFAITHSVAARCSWILGGLLYVGLGCWLLYRMRSNEVGFEWILILLATTVAIDVGAYFSGRRFGGPKIAPEVSPSKTWSGLAGGMIAAAAIGAVVTYIDHSRELSRYAQYVSEFGQPTDWFFQGWRWGQGILCGFAAAIVAQSGDFFESWMKRRAGVKDSGNLLPGHGGLFDRVDGLLALLAVSALYFLGVTGGTAG